MAVNFRSRMWVDDLDIAVVAEILWRRNGKWWIYGTIEIEASREKLKH